MNSAAVQLQLGEIKSERLMSEDDAISAAKLFADHIRPGAAERDAKRLRPLREISVLRQSGLLGVTAPKDLGGIEISIGGLIEIFKLISAADPAIGQIPQNHFSHLENIRTLGSAEQKQFFYGKALEGALLGNALSERGTAGGQRNLQTTLRRNARGAWILNGKKYYTTGALFAQWLPVTALDEEGRPHVAHVPRDAVGVEVIDDWDAMGQRGTASGSAIFSDVAVADDHVVATWRRDERPSTRPAFGQIMHVAVDIGIAEEALADAAHFVQTHSRPWHGANLERAGDDPHVLRRVGELSVQIQAASALLDRAASVFDQVLSKPLTQDNATRVAMLVGSAKAAASAAAVQASTDLFALAGTSATDEKWNLHRHWRNARTHTLHDPEAWKYHYIGDWIVNGRDPPRRALFL